MRGSFERLSTEGFRSAGDAAKGGDDWAAGGFMRLLCPDPSDVAPPRSDMERAATVAFDVALLGERGGPEGRAAKGDREALSEILHAAVRIEASRRPGEDAEPATDLQRARGVLVAMAAVMVARDQASGFEPEPLENRAMEAMRRHSGIEASAMSHADASAVAVGMPDMLGEDGRAHVGAALERSRDRSAHDWLEAALASQDLSWPRAAERGPALDRAVFRSPSIGPAASAPPSPVRAPDLGRD